MGRHFLEQTDKGLTKGVIREIFTDQIMDLFKEDVKRDGETLGLFCEALQSGNAAEVERLSTVYLGRTVSIRDTFARKPTKENLPTGKATTKAFKVQKPSVCFFTGFYLASWALNINGL